MSLFRVTCERQPSSHAAVLDQLTLEILRRELRAEYQRLAGLGTAHGDQMAHAVDSVASALARTIERLMEIAP